MFSRYAHTLTHKVLITAVILTVYEHLKDCFCESCSARDELHFIPPLKQTMLLFVSFVFLFCSCSGGFCLFFANAILGNRCLPRTMCQTASTQEGMSESSPFFPPKKLGACLQSLGMPNTPDRDFGQFLSQHDCAAVPKARSMKT